MRVRFAVALSGVWFAIGLGVAAIVVGSALATNLRDAGHPIGVAVATGVSLAIACTSLGTAIRRRAARQRQPGKDQRRG